jgi:hypothetical protein
MLIMEDLFVKINILNNIIRIGLILKAYKG